MPATKVAGGVRSTLRILQMDCPTEEALIRNRLATMPAVGNLDFNLMQRTLTVDHTPDALDAVLDAVRSLGFEPELTAPGQRARPVDESPPLRWWPLAAAGMLALAAEALDWFGQPALLAAACALAAIAISGTGTYRKGWIAIRNGNLNINALMSIAVTGAMLLGEWPEAAMVMVLFSVAEVIEARSLDRARNAIRGLMQLVPPSASVVNTDGSVTRIDAAAVAVGQVVRVRPGERVGLDGIVINGRSTLNQAPISGESLPIDKGPGDTVFAGSINESGAFDYRVTAAANDTMLARIIHAVEEAQGAKAPTQRFIDRFARVYTPVVFALALAVAVLPPVFAAADWHEWIYKALVLLVIACPCALVISTPVTIVSGLAAAARHGILIKGGVYLENGRKLAWLAFDKTGTLTHGKPEQTDFESIGDVDAERCLRLAASLSERSDHPVSQAIVRAAAAAGVTPEQVESFEAVGGRGVRATIDGARYALGNHRMLHEQALCSDALEARVDMLERQGKTVVALFDDARVLGLFAVADTLKDSSLAAVAELHRLGVKTLMLSGDNPHTVQAIAHALGIDEARGNLLPADKLAAIEHLAAQGMVGMAGDGINDAPAIARADIGFAMGAMGTDTAIETADVALMDDDLGKIATFVRLSRSTHALLVQNIALALGIKAVFLLLTLAGMSTMWMAVFADMGASLIVVGNGLRLLRKG
ncbi:heavy metal translocating P-type ATPase [Azoarcus sp. L1K30]|uniref:heavy metal translocating P-type ATPase n=1 Tax=Azoarcus sp. L1K30 TaxID=2820277 RepID=UPI0032C23653